MGAYINVHNLYVFIHKPYIYITKTATSERNGLLSAIFHIVDYVANQNIFAQHRLCIVFCCDLWFK